MDLRPPQALFNTQVGQAAVASQEDVALAFFTGLIGNGGNPLAGIGGRFHSVLRNGMKMHHQGAITMAEAELKMSNEPQMKKMAKNIIAAQKKEIAQFDKFLAKHKT